MKQAAEQRFVLRKRHHAIANIPWREDAIFPSQAAGAAAVIGDGNDCSQIYDGPLRRGIRIMARDDMQLKPAKKRGKAGTTAKSDHPNSLR